MKLIKINLDKSSNINCDFEITEDNTILYVKVSGDYRSGSEGNSDGLYLFSLIVANYFMYEPICIILDLRNIKYNWGNTILKSLNFFNEIGRDEDEKNKLIIIIHSSENLIALTELLKMVANSNRIMCKNYDEALSAAIRNVEEYLGEC